MTRTDKAAWTVALLIWALIIGFCWSRGFFMRPGNLQAGVAAIKG
jgi:hypothetical protein